MSRALRIQFPGAWYHVMNRGAARRDVFRTSADRRDFLSLLGSLGPGFQAEVHAYCLMGSHYHLLLRTLRPNLSRAMRHVDGLYTQRFHRRHGTDGPLFRGRYRAVLVQADRHLVHVSRYIHLNPVDAGLISRPEEWGWSSCRAYLDPGRALPWLRTDVILQSFGCVGARRHYRQFLDEGLDPGTRDFYGRSRLGPALGDDGFREELRRRAALEIDADAERLPDLGRLHDRTVPLAQIAEAVCAAFGVGPEALRRRPTGRGRSAGLARGAFVRAARQLGDHRLRDIAGWLGYSSYAAAARAATRFSAAATRDDTIRGRLAAVVECLAPGQVAGLGRSRGSMSDVKT